MLAKRNLHSNLSFEAEALNSILVTSFSFEIVDRSRLVQCPCRMLVSFPKQPGDRCTTCLMMLVSLLALVASWSAPWITAFSPSPIILFLYSSSTSESIWPSLNSSTISERDALRMMFVTDILNLANQQK